MSIQRARVTWVWLALIVATCATTWGLSKDLFSAPVAVAGIFLIAAVKVRYVIIDFMELRHAPTPVRLMAQVWIGGVTIMILAFWVLTPAVA